MSNFFHHLDLTVSDPAKSRPLYELFLGHCGVTLLKAKGRNAKRKHDRYSAGLHHLALRAKSREDVDALYRKLRKFGAMILDPPADYPDYGKGCYTVFFADADGMKLEYAYTPLSAEKRVKSIALKIEPNP